MWSSGYKSLGWPLTHHVSHHYFSTLSRQGRLWVVDIVADWCPSPTNRRWLPVYVRQAVMTNSGSLCSSTGSLLQGSPYSFQEFSTVLFSYCPLNTLIFQSSIPVLSLSASLPTHTWPLMFPLLGTCPTWVHGPETEMRIRCQKETVSTIVRERGPQIAWEVLHSFQNFAWIGLQSISIFWVSKNGYSDCQFVPHVFPFFIWTPPWVALPFWPISLMS